ncbi:MAG: GyrI-like domain-containing protein [Propionicimonas sp.]|jgi:effector-binding domain-containing protein
MIINEPVPEPTLLTVAEEPTAVVRHTGVTVADLPALFDAGYPALAASGAPLSGPAFALYLGDPMAVFDLEIGFPVATPLPAAIPGAVTVEPGVLPSGPAFVLTHFGSYDTLGESWGRLAAEAAARGFVPSLSFELYVSDPTPQTDPATLRTDLFLLGTPASAA